MKKPSQREQRSSLKLHSQEVTEPGFRSRPGGCRALRLNCHALPAPSNYYEVSPPLVNSSTLARPKFIPSLQNHGHTSVS